MSLKSIKEKFETHKGEMVLMSKKVYQLIGICEDVEDLYWVLYDGRKLKLSTCVGGFAILKNKLDDKDYNELIRIAKLNWYSSYGIYGIKEGDFEYNSVMKSITQNRKNLEKEIVKPCESDPKYTNKLIADIVWEFN